MKQLSIQTGCAVLAASALLAGCGGGGSDDGGSGAGSDVPASALQNPAGLTSFQVSLNNTGTNSTSTPLDLGSAPLPTSDTTEPTPVN